jgi:hypothetical protein
MNNNIFQSNTVSGNDGVIDFLINAEVWDSNTQYKSLPINLTPPLPLKYLIPVVQYGGIAYQLKDRSKISTIGVVPSAEPNIWIPYSGGGAGSGITSINGLTAPVQLLTTDSNLEVEQLTGNTNKFSILNPNLLAWCGFANLSLQNANQFLQINSSGDGFTSKPLAISDVSGLQASLTGINNQIDALNNEVSALNNQIITSVNVSGGNVTGTGTVSNNVLNLNLNASGGSGGIVSINGDATLAQLLTSQINGVSSGAFAWTNPTAGTQQLNLALNTNFFGIASNQITISNPNLLSIGNLSISGGAGKALVVNDTNDGFALKQFVSTVGIDSGTGVSVQNLNLIAGTNITLAQAINGDITINASGGGSGGITSINASTASAQEIIGDNTVTEVVDSGTGNSVHTLKIKNLGIAVTSSDTTVVQNGQSSYNPATGVISIDLSATQGGSSGVTSFTGAQEGSTPRPGAVIAELGDYNASIIRMDNTADSEVLSTKIASIDTSITGLSGSVVTLQSQTVTNFTFAGGNVSGTANFVSGIWNLALTAPSSVSNVISFSSAQLVGANALGTGLNYQDANAVVLPYRCIAIGANAVLSTMNLPIVATGTNKIELSVGIQCFADNTLSTPSNMVFPYILYVFNNSTNSLTQIDSGNFSFTVNAKSNQIYTSFTNNVSVGIATNNFVLLVQGISGSNGHIGLLSINITPTLS